MDCRLEVGHGRTEIVIDGIGQVPLIYSTSRLDPGQIRLFKNLGVSTVSFPATCDFHLYGLAEPVWRSPESHDYSSLDSQLSLIFEANPTAWVLPRVFTCSPPWWNNAHPGELVIWEDGSLQRPLLHGALEDRVPSLGSTAWREAMQQNIRKLIRHVEDGPWGDRVLGYMVTSGNSEEWFHWGTMEGYLFDYNPQVEDRFRDWLEKRYGSDESLSKAWGRLESIAGAVTPPADVRRDLDPLGCRHPVTRRDVVDYASFFGDLTAEVISGTAACVKEETNGSKLFGTFYGYLVELAYHPDGIQNGGHVGLKRLLADPNVDFLASPSSYARRLPGEGYSFSMVPARSLEVHGKAFFHENDVRTHVLEDDAGYGRTDHAFGTCSIQRREFAHALTHGHGMWWFDMTSGWYDNPAVHGAIANVVEISGKSRSIPRENVAEIAIVLDESGMLHVGNPPNQITQLIAQQCLELSRVGAPFDVIRLDDLLNTTTYRLLVFPNAFHMPEQRRRELHDFLEKTGATSLWIHLAGAISNDVSLENMAKLTGIRVSPPADPHFNVVQAEINGTTHSYGSYYWHDRIPVAADPGAEILGTFVRTGEPGLAMKKMNGWTSVWSAAPAVAGRVLRHFAAEAGVHLYADSDDAVYACSGFVGIHARNSGLKEIRVPDTDALYDLVHKTEVSMDDGAFRTWIPKGETALFYRGTRAKWESI